MIDYEADPRPFGDLLKAWRPDLTRAQKADELRTPVATLNGWCDGRPCRHEGALRRLMTLLDARPDRSTTC